MEENAAYVNSAEGIKRMMNNPKLYFRLLTKFVNDTKLDTLEKAFADGDAAKIQGEVHTLKGLAGNLSLPLLYDRCLEMETRIKSGTIDGGQMEAVGAVFAATLQAIEKVVAENG